MRSHMYSAIALSLSLSGAVLAEQMRAMYEPECIPDDSKGSLDDCQDAVNEVWGMRGGMGTKMQGCKTVATPGIACRIDLCDINDEGSTVDYIAIATAAQISLALCRSRSDTVTGGKTVVEGYQLDGQAHSIATVYVNNDLTFIPKRDVEDDVAAANATMERIDRRAGLEFPVGWTQWTVVEEFALNWRQPAWDYTMFPQQRDRLRDALLADWNRAAWSFGGFVVRRRSGASGELEDGGQRYNLAITGRDRRTISDIPIVDRGPIIDAMLQLHAARNGPRTITAYLRNGNEGNRLEAMITLVVNPAAADSAPKNWILFRPGSGALT